MENPELTQLIYLHVKSTISIAKSPKSGERSAFQDVLDLLKGTPGYVRMYWGRRVEEPEIVHVHVVRTTMHHHKTFLSSAALKTLTTLATTLAPPTSKPTSLPPHLTIRHTLLHGYHPSHASQSLGLGAPVTGTAVYFVTSPPVWDAAYAKWSAIVPSVPGFMGISGGYIEEPVDGKENVFIALVGWETVAAHDAYHRTLHFRANAGVLAEGQAGYAEYGHIALTHRDGRGGRSVL